MLLPDDKGEIGTAALTRFLYEILSHLETSRRLETSPALSAYMGIFGLSGLTQIQNIQDRLFRTGAVTDEELIYMLHLMGRVDATTIGVLRDEQSVFGFDRGPAGDGTMNILVWTMPDSGEVVRAKKVIEAADKFILGQSIEQREREVLKVVVHNLREMKARNEKLVIKPVPELPLDR